MPSRVRPGNPSDPRLRRRWAVGCRGELDSQPDGLDHGRNPINSSNLSTYLNPDGGGDGAENTERNRDSDVKQRGDVCLTCGA